MAGSLACRRLGGSALRPDRHGHGHDMNLVDIVVCVFFSCYVAWCCVLLGVLDSVPWWFVCDTHTLALASTIQHFLLLAFEPHILGSSFTFRCALPTTPCPPPPFPHTPPPVPFPLPLLPYPVWYDLGQVGSGTRHGGVRGKLLPTHPLSFPSPSLSLPPTPPTYPHPPPPYCLPTTHTYPTTSLPPPLPLTCPWTGISLVG